jgi:2-polyprenyl-3-methyl-5-hydroxy-6-metoxy-1,4-benzoquinol methylase
MTGSLQAKEDHENEAAYILGHSPAEIQRLTKQAAVIRTITERMLRSAGIAPGMRVLDLGCGVGDVAMLAAESVGASGSVVGIDRNPDVLAVARKRIQAAGARHVTFRQTSVEVFVDPGPFDLVIGRYILLYQQDPVAFLKAAARFAAGGILALHEPILDRPVHSRPNVALWEHISALLLTAFRAVAPSWDAAGRLVELFSSAGLPQPTLYCETPVGGGADAPHYGLLADLARTLLPRMIETGIATAEVVCIDTLENRLKAAAVNARSQVEWSAQVCAWTRV